MPMIDADAHVIESERTWEYLDGGDSKFRPVIITPHNDREQFWLIDRRAFRRSNVNQSLPEASREMQDIEARLRHMDELGIDIQVLYPSLFLRPYTTDPEIEAALCRSYNRWLADIWRKGEGRLRWATALPLMSMTETLAQARFGKDHGACGLFIRGLPEDRLPNDPYFYPLYEEASRLDLPVCFHASTGSFVWEEQFKAAEEGGFELVFGIPILCSFHIVAYAGIPERFPKLRFGFIEAKSQWVPYAVHDIARRYETEGGGDSKDIMRNKRLYVTCQTDDDLPFVLKYSGENNLVIGTDYGHIDPSAEIEALRSLKLRREISPEVIDKILWDNPKALYHI